MEDDAIRRSKYICYYHSPLEFIQLDLIGIPSLIIKTVSSLNHKQNIWLYLAVQSFSLDFKEILKHISNFLWWFWSFF